MQAKTFPRTDASIRRHALRVLQLSLASFTLAGPVLAQQAPPAPRPGAAAAADPKLDPKADKKTDVKAAELAFQKADADKDGRLSRNEAASLPAVAARFDELDADKDGQLSMAEYLAGVTPAR